MNIQIPHNADKESVLDSVERYIGDLSLEIAEEDRARPWGGFFVIANESIGPFIQQFFPDIDKEQITKYGDTLSPKILVVAPHQELSWQYHNRRAELWRVIDGPVGIIVNDNDEQTDVQSLDSGEIVEHGNMVRHRLVGLDNWGILAEIWQHTDPANPSDEDDIIRLQDNYGRES